MKKKLLVVLISVCMIVSCMAGLTLTASADGEWSKYSDGVTTLGTTVIGSPQASGTNPSGWAGDYVYYGQYNSNPVKYRVLDPNSTAFGVTDGSMLLDCDSILEKVRFDNDANANAGATNANEWAHSDLKTWLNTTESCLVEDDTNKAGFLNSFTAAENAAIAASTKSAAATGDKADGNGFNSLGYAKLSNDKIFVLDAKEATNTSYGYANENGSVNARKKSGASEYCWWLRSPYSSSANYAGYVDGTIDFIAVSHDVVGVSPAFNVNLDSVLFTSQVNNETGTYGKEYKLTLKDSNTTITLETLTRIGNTVTVPYTVTDSTPSDGVTADTVSVLITNAAGTEIKYYAPLTGTFAMTGASGTFDIPDDFDANNDKIYILAEDVNSQYLTDYASEMVEIALPPAVTDTSWSKFADGVTTLGTGAIGSPQASGTNASGWAGDYVYYGQYKSSPVKYRVLDPNSTAFGGTTMLLDCDSILEMVLFVVDSGSDCHNEWARSDLKAWLNTTESCLVKRYTYKDGFLNSFTGAENTAIATSTKASPADGDGNGYLMISYAGLSDDRIFVLDAKEATNTSYGYADTSGDDIARKKSGASEYYCWWLRSPYNNDSYIGSCVWIRNASDIRGYTSYNNHAGVSPAFNIDLNSVIFSSVINPGAAGTYGKEYKLTLKDNNTTITAGTLTRSGNTVTVPYTVTDNTPSDGITADTVSVLILDSSNAVKYYAPLTGTFAMTGGSGTFDLPDDFDADSDTVYILAEDVNTQYLTDYASVPVEITISHAHTLTHYPASSGDCKTKGNTEYWVCTGTAEDPACGKWFSDAEGTTEIDDHDSVYTEYGAHKYSTVKENEKAATCTAAGSYDEVEKCSVCGDVKSRTTKTVPALGHDYQNGVCSRCGAADPNGRNAAPWAEKPEYKPSGASGTASTPTTPVKKPEPKIGDKEGVPAIIEEIGKIPEGGTLPINMNGTTELPKEIIEALKGKDVDLVLDMGGGITWTINGKDISSVSGSIDLGVALGTSDIPIDVVNNVTGEHYSTTIHLNHSGAFGFKAVMTVPLRKQDAGLIANLFYYDPGQKALEFVSSALIDANGNADLDFNHASDYAIIIDDHSLDGSEETADEAITEDTETSDDENSVDNAVDDSNPHTGAALGGLTVLMLAGAAMIVSKKRK